MANKSGHIEVIAKIKQKNNADFKLMDATDVEMSGGQSVQEVVESTQRAVENKQIQLIAGAGITLDEQGNISAEAAAIESITIETINGLWDSETK